MKPNLTPSALLMMALFVAVAPASSAQGGYETAPLFHASEILPPELVRGPIHTVDQSVRNDGIMNIYRLNSPFGEFEADSTAELKIRIREVYAIEAMKKVQSSDEFMNAVVGEGEKILTTAKDLITDPGNTLSNALSGVGKMFERADAKLSGDTRSQAEGSAMDDLIGLSKTKREVAYEYGVDVYSSNKVLQESLDRLAGAGYFAGLGTGLAIGAVTGPLVAVTQGTRMMNDVFRTTPPVDLRMMNRKKLAVMGVAPDIIDLFIGNTVFSPRHQTLLVAALEDMPDATGRGAFVKFAVQVQDEDVALFRQRQAQMYAGYNRSVEPIAGFVPVGQLAAARLKDGTLVFNVPLDHFAWTQGTARFIESVEQQIATVPDVKAKQLWVTGTVSALMRKQLEGRGWTVNERATKLIPEGQ